MGKFGLQICATLENVASFSCKGKNLVWAMKFKCSNCKDDTPNWQEFSLMEQIACKSGHGTCNLLIGCKTCKKKMQIIILPECFADYTQSDSEKFKTVAAFDVRGSEPVECRFSEGWEVKTDSNKAYPNIDLWESQSDWVEYDEISKQPIAISELRCQFVKI